MSAQVRGITTIYHMSDDTFDVVAMERGASGRFEMRWQLQEVDPDRAGAEVRDYLAIRLKEVSREA